MNIFSKEKYPNCHKGYQYMLDVQSGKIVTNIYIKAMYKKVIEDYKRDDLYYFDVEWAEKFLRLFQNFHHVIGEWENPNIILEPWQCAMFMTAEGFYWKSTGKRKYKSLHCEVARGNGKSAISSVTGLIYLSLYKNILGNKVYAVATKKEQARIVLDSAREMAKKNKSFLNHTGTEVFAHEIKHNSSGSEFRALSSDSNSLDGLQPVLGIIDELHAHRDRKVYDVVDSAMSKRADSLLLVITTAGFSVDGIGFSQSQYSKKVSIGEIPDESFLGINYCLDIDDDWKDEKNWIKANPNLGVSVDIESFRNKAFKAANNPADEINFKVKHLNLPQNSASQFFNRKKWEECADYELKMEDFLGKPCFVGIDLASKKDLTAFAYIFKEFDTKIQDDIYYIFVDCFVPELAVEISKNVKYKQWVDSGELIKTAGNAISYQEIEKKFVQNSKKYKFTESFYDGWNATEFSQNMSRERIEMCEFRMNTGNLSEPMKRLDALILEGRVRHNGSDLLGWCLSNVVAKYDHNENVFPRKEHEDMKIDPIVSMIMAIAGYVNQEQQESVYESRGMVFI